MRLGTGLVHSGGHAEVVAVGLRRVEQVAQVLRLAFDERVLVRRVYEHFAVGAFLEQRQFLRLLVWLHVEVDQAPFLEERMHAHDGAHISRQVAAASGACQVGEWVLSVEIDHEEAVFLVDLGCFGREHAREKLRQ